MADSRQVGELVLSTLSGHSTCSKVTIGNPASRLSPFIKNTIEEFRERDLWRHPEGVVSRPEIDLSRPSGGGRV
jgi:hypothetical protein